MDELRIRVSHAGGRHVVRFSGVLDFAASVRLRVALFGQLDSGVHELIVDLSRVRLIDASSVGVLLQVQQHAEEAGGSLRVLGASGLVLEALEIVGAAKALGLYGPAQLEPLPARDASEPRQDPWGVETTGFMREMAALPADHPDRPVLRRQIVEQCLPYAERLARRFNGLGEPLEDLVQVAALGLIKAVDGYDPTLGTEFGAYATPTVLGELKRHFRDKGWGVHVPRWLQELRMDVSRARESLVQQLGRSPTVADLAEHLGVEQDRVLEALVASARYRPASLYAPVGQDDERSPIDYLGEEDASLDAVDFRESLRPLLNRLPRREMKIVAMRFYGNMTQAKIAAELGISQMHVSRLLTRTLGRLRDGLREAA
jgi:RNA polymerase sigma-70 factor (sigma-B/F/G subfamily)